MISPRVALRSTSENCRFASAAEMIFTRVLLSSASHYIGGRAAATIKPQSCDGDELRQPKQQHFVADFAMNALLIDRTQLKDSKRVVA